MKITISKTTANPRDLIRRAGYAEFRDPRTGEISYVRRLHLNFFPRFHAHLEKDGENVVINLHLDQKQPSYRARDVRAHAGEYDGAVVTGEAERIKAVLGAK